MKLEFSRQVFGKYSNAKFYTFFFPVEAKFFCADKERKEQTDFRKVIVAFRRIANASKRAG
jgi:hypothetical protein